MNCLRLFNNFNHNFFDFDSDIENFFRPVFPRNIFEEESSDEEIEKTQKKLRKSRKNILRKNPQLKSSSYTQSYYSKTSLNDEGKPITYTYQNQVEDHVQDGHQYRKRKEEINKNGNKKSVLEKQMDNKVHRIIKSTNDKGETKQKNVFKGIKENDLESFNKTFDEEFNKAFNWNCFSNQKQQLPQEKKELDKEKSDDNEKDKKNDKSKDSSKIEKSNSNKNEGS